MHQSAYDVAGDDPRMAKLLRASLTKLANGPDGPLKEMADGVLSGQLDLREAAMSDAYGEELGVAFGRFQTYFDALDEEERQELVGQAEERLDELLDGPYATNDS
jgi:hypothetical protein